jgi:hypothetical protein
MDTIHPTTIADDIAAQDRWLQAEARARGYANVDALMEADYPLFEKLAKLWDQKSRAQGGAKLSRAPSTQAAYEARIDELFAGDRANRTGVTILDSSDVMGLLDFAKVPLVLNESHVANDGQTNHPEMTAKVWKQVPQWIENPAAVYTDPKHPGRLTLVAPSRVAGYPVVIAIEPNTERGKPDHLLVTAFAKTTGGLPPMGVLASSGRLLFADTKMAPEIWSGIGDNPRPTRLIARAKKILTEKNLAGYRRQQGAALSRAPAQQSVEERADQVLAKTTASAKPLDRLTKAATQATGIDRLTRAAFERGAYLIDPLVIFIVQRLRNARYLYDSVALQDGQEENSAASPRDTLIVGERATPANTKSSGRARQNLKRFNHCPEQGTPGGPKRAQRVLDEHRGQPLTASLHKLEVECGSRVSGG